MTLQYLGHSAFRFEVNGLNIYVDPYLRDPVDWTKLPKGEIVLLSHGHFDHGVFMSPKLYDAWKCQFMGPKKLMTWMKRKYRRVIPPEQFVAIDSGETRRFAKDGKSVEITAIPAHHPINRLGKTILHLFARSSAPGKPVNGYLFEGGYYHSGDTIYYPALVESLKGKKVHTACLPIGGKYAVASPAEALRIAEEIGAERIVPMHWQALMQRVPFRYQSSDLVKLGKQKKTKVSIHALAIGESLEPVSDSESIA